MSGLNFERSFCDWPYDSRNWWNSGDKGSDFSAWLIFHWQLRNTTLLERRGVWSTLQSQKGHIPGSKHAPLSVPPWGAKGVVARRCPTWTSVTVAPWQQKKFDAPYTGYPIDLILPSSHVPQSPCDCHSGTSWSDEWRPWFFFKIGSSMISNPAVPLSWRYQNYLARTEWELPFSCHPFLRP